MEGNFKYFVDNDCLICEDSHLLVELVEKLDFDIFQFKQQHSYLPKIILNERQPVRFLAGFIAACKANCPVFLCNPDWGKQEWLQVFDLVKPDIIWGIKPKAVEASYFLENSHNTDIYNAPCPIPNAQSPYIMIPTGGSSGRIKFAVHTWDTLTASVLGFKEYFQVDQINSFCVLPLYHVSGLMQFMRCFITGGKLIVLPFKSLESKPVSYSKNNFNQLISSSEYFISLVPTQLERLLQKSDLAEWLSKFQTVLLGGAPAWNELLQKARFHCIRLAPTYGMTETASQIATMKSDDFIQGKVGCGKILPHAKITICGKKGEELKVNQIGNINIQAKSLALGYYPLSSKTQTCLQIDDLAFLNEQGYLNIVGRNSDKIITGGENVYPTEVEAVIRATGMVADVCVIGLADKYWGEVVTAIYVVNSGINHPAVKMPALQQDKNERILIQTLLKEKLSNYKIPKVWIPVDSLPRNSQGKINRQKLYEIAVSK
ncbi:acyl-CoA synthetase (AMP-forming)/AMP-acid ligase II [Rivularia sp. PCC 7116]|uniref:2-succinylbenzoate--CoA ligase n=1 Tax=Rivularia sp. PCC 7116 TaxID=373994 RepID=UPI00029EFBC3|nr:2-succinylbenzoate--CoA ligase [Rivularia sp. PCC 7116]AFY52674.1 acyl-CoA synthetase (AMP-forming)/AMP-acid ligase II [Rivularia sp. PCC 7116]